MRVIAGSVVFITILAGLLALPGTASAKSAGDNAFLIEYVDNVEGLVRQVDGSRLLALRYAKHYKVDPATVIAYFQNELSVEELKEDATFDVYQRKGTGFETVTKKFKAGTKVFVNQNGIPVLEIGTGNPLLDSLPGKDFRQLPTTVPGLTTSPLGVPTEPDTAVLASGPIETVSRGGGSGMAGWILPVAGAALLGAGSGGGSSPQPDNGMPTAVPEPGALLALGTGMVSLAGMTYRRIRRR